ncbi:MAG: DUF4430 domain-containing protein [Lachnospiraceae bacterium]|nr:DUF4430 domain-containing protein [Lachnospiraceae bacterium]
METKKKKNLLNFLMVLVILVMAFCGVMAAGSLKGWFGGEEKSFLITEKVTGVVNIERKGVGYSLKRDQSLKAGDILEARQGSSAEVAVGAEGVLALNENTEAEITSCEDNSLEFHVLNGEIFADFAPEHVNVKLSFGDNTAQAEEAVLSVSVQTGSCSVNVYAGKLDVLVQDGSEEHVEAGQILTVSTDAYEKAHVSVEEFQPESMNEFMILQAQKCTSKNELMFSAARLQSVLDDREAEKQSALEESLNSSLHVPAESKEDRLESEDLTTTDTSDENRPEENTEDGEKDESGADVSSSGGQEGSGNAQSGGQEGSGNAQSGGQEGTGDSSSDGQAEAALKTCTITIRCDTILDNLENLTAGKEAYVPANGCILSTSTVEFEDGETVFDVLERVCSYAGIQLEYSWTPMYNSYYIEGINHLYEFDCGNESGWMYKVNGWFPNYGCSSYTLQGGDTIVWCYTCNGLGADVGGAAY